MGPGYCHCNYGKYCSYIGNIKTKSLSVHNLTKEEEATKNASKSKAKARTRAILAKAKAAAARAKAFEKAFEKGQAKAKTKAKANAKANAKTKAGGLDPRVSIMKEDIQSLFDTVQVYRDWLNSVQDRVLKLEGAVIRRRN